MLTKVHNFDIVFPRQDLSVRRIPKKKSLVSVGTKQADKIPAKPEVISQPNPSMGLRMIKGLGKLILYLAFVGSAIVYTPKILANTLKTQYPLATITSGSMWPILKTNDLIFMKGASASDVVVGQIIIFKNDGGFTIHRLIRVENGKFVTKGDANNTEDRPIEKSAVIGRVVYIGNHPLRIPVMGKIARSMSPTFNNLRGK